MERLMNTKLQVMLSLNQITISENQHSILVKKNMTTLLKSEQETLS